jgi:hypothetical protein
MQMIFLFIGSQQSKTHVGYLNVGQKQTFSVPRATYEMANMTLVSFSEHARVIRCPYRTVFIPFPKENDAAHTRRGYGPASVTKHSAASLLKLGTPKVVPVEDAGEAGAYEIEEASSHQRTETPVEPTKYRFVISAFFFLACICAHAFLVTTFYDSFPCLCIHASVSVHQTSAKRFVFVPSGLVCSVCVCCSTCVCMCTYTSLIIHACMWLYVYEHG